jgi:hypothetical protein
MKYLFPAAAGHTVLRGIRNCTSDGTCLSEEDRDEGSLRSVSRGSPSRPACYDNRENGGLAVQRFLPTIATLAPFPVAGIGRAQDVVRVTPEHNKKPSWKRAMCASSKTLLPQARKTRCTPIPPAGTTSPSPERSKSFFAGGQVATWEAGERVAGWLRTNAPHTSENARKTTLVYVLIEVKSAHAPHSLPAERSRGSNQ